MSTVHAEDAQESTATLALAFSRYVDRDPHRLEPELSAAVRSALRSAATRIGSSPPGFAVERWADETDRMHIRSTLPELDHVTVGWNGGEGLTELRVVVRVEGDTTSKTQVLAANRFVQAFTDEMQAA